MVDAGTSGFEPKTRYAKTADGVSIAFQVLGDGPFDLVLIPGFVSNVDHYWEMPIVPALLRRLASFSRLILWDKRGTGRSDPVSHVPTLEERMDDLQAVMDAAGSEQAAIFGISEGCGMAMMFSAAHPERTTALVLYGGSPKFRSDGTWPWGWSAEQAAPWFREIDEMWGDGALLEVFAPTCVGNEGVQRIWGRYERAGASPAMGKAMLEALLTLDCRHIVPVVRVPTLVLHRTGDRMAHIGAARWMATEMPQARLVEMPGDDHLPFLGDTDRLFDEAEEFLTGVRHSSERDRVLATVLFTDIVGSTDRAAAIGDQLWHDLLEGHNERVRREVLRTGGREVKTIGDGFLVAFDGPTRGIDCAVGARSAVRELGIEIRAGLHSGECELAGDDVVGLAVNIGARVSSLAGPSEVLVSSTVKDLVIGSRVRFEDRGSHVLKGIPGEWRLFAVA